MRDVWRDGERRRDEDERWAAQQGAMETLDWTFREVQEQQRFIARLEFEGKHDLSPFGRCDRAAERHVKIAEAKRELFGRQQRHADAVAKAKALGVDVAETPRGS